MSWVQLIFFIFRFFVISGSPFYRLLLFIFQFIGILSNADILYICCAYVYYIMRMYGICIHREICNFISNIVLIILKYHTLYAGKA